MIRNILCKKIGDNDVYFSNEELIDKINEIIDYINENEHHFKR
jgi:hypothetical protein